MSRWFKRLALLLPALIVLMVVVGWMLMRGSLPQLDGELALAGLSAPVQVQRDALGIVTIDAANEADMARALGYVHAQERYFEMDLLRRTAAGELAELFGPAAVDTDRKHRVHRFRARVTQHLDAFAGDRMPLLQAYADGVNAGLEALSVRPWPYLVLRQRPRPWEVADSALVGYAMYFDLQDSTNSRELALWKMQPVLPPALFELLTRDGSSWDAPLLGQARGDAVLPDASQLDLRALPSPDGDAFDAPQDLDTPGSNNWAVSGALTRDGRAIVADDMHLGLRAPNIWFRARLRYADALATSGTVDSSGFTLPGLPAVVVGSNTHVAWGFTNAYGDWADWALVRPCAGTGGKRPCEMPVEHSETIEVAGGDPVELTVRETAWGPVLHEQPDGQLLALRWVAHLPGAVQVSLAEFARAGDIDTAFALADRVGIPAQNMVMGDRSGRIAWRLLSQVPRRGDGCDPTAPIDGAAPGVGSAMNARLPVAVAPCAPWSADASVAPRLPDPPGGRVWSANNRVVDGNELAMAGDGGYALGARALQIRDRLMASDRFDEEDLLAIQLDDRALFLERWRQLMQRQAQAVPGGPIAALFDEAGDWHGRASVESSSYRAVRAWRLAVHERIVDGLTAPARAALGEDFEMPSLPQLEGVVWPLLVQRPRHLLPSRFDSWDALMQDAAREVREELGDVPGDPRTWGDRNTARICHPLAAALPALLKSALCMPADPLPGDSNMPRVQGPSFGASQRMVVSPGHEADGIAHMPGGQSGNPLSPFWGAGHDDWVHGRASPFLPGEGEYVLTMKP